MTRRGRLLVGAAIGATKDVLDRVAALVEAGVDVLVWIRPMGIAIILLRALNASKPTIPMCS